MKKKKLTKRQDGKRLNEEGRLSPLEVLQRRMEHHDKLAAQEMAKGDEASQEEIASQLAAAQNAAVELAPYRHPRLQATAVMASTTSDLARLLKSIDENAHAGEPTLSIDSTDEQAATKH